MGAEELIKKKCKPCEGGVAPLTKDQAQGYLKALPQWSLNQDGKSIQSKFVMKNFVAAIDFINKIKEVAEGEGHHPDLHLTGYRNLEIEMSTHAIGGLSENDFIMAAKIDGLPRELKS